MVQYGIWKNKVLLYWPFTVAKRAGGFKIQTGRDKEQQAHYFSLNEERIQAMHFRWSCSILV